LRASKYDAGLIVLTMLAALLTGVELAIVVADKLNAAWRLQRQPEPQRPHTGPR
jgi:hypothetical protein